MMKNKLLYVKTLVVSGVLMITSCTSDNEQQGMITYDVRSAIDHASMLNLDQEIADVHYVPLEMTDDDESLIDGILDYAVTTKYIYMYCPPKKLALSCLTGKETLLRPS